MARQTKKKKIKKSPARPKKSASKTVLKKEKKATDQFGGVKRVELAAVTAGALFLSSLRARAQGGPCY